MIGGFFLAFQCTLLYYFLDNFRGGSYTPYTQFPFGHKIGRNSLTTLPKPKKKKKRVDIPRIKYFIRTLLSVYTVILIVKVVLYIYIVDYTEALTVDPHLDNRFGMFQGNVFENKGVAILVTFLVLVMIILCYSLSVKSARFLTEIENILHERARL